MTDNSSGTAASSRNDSKLPIVFLAVILFGLIAYSQTTRPQNSGAAYLVNSGSITYSAIASISTSGENYFFIQDTKDGDDFNASSPGAPSRIGVAEKNALGVLVITKIQLTNGFSSASGGTSIPYPHDLESACVLDRSGPNSVTLLAAESGGIDNPRIFKILLEKIGSVWSAKIQHIWTIDKNISGVTFKSFEGMHCWRQTSGEISVLLADRGYHPAWQPSRAERDGRIYFFTLDPAAILISLDDNTSHFNLRYGKPNGERNGTTLPTTIGKKKGFLSCRANVPAAHWNQHRGQDDAPEQRDVSDIFLEGTDPDDTLWASASFDGKNSFEFCSVIYKVCDWSECLALLNAKGNKTVSLSKKHIRFPTLKVEGFALANGQFVVATDEELSGQIRLVDVPTP